MTVRVIEGDCRVALALLADRSVHCVVTSPPYFGLRDYGTATWAGGGAECDHLQGKLVSPKSTLRSDGRDHIGPYAGEKAVSTGTPFGQVCGKCGATRTDSQIGLEATPAAFISEMVSVFREVRRVLRDDGTLWLNLGDSYARDIAKGKHKPGDSGKQNYIIERGGGRAAGGIVLRRNGDSDPPPGLKAKDLMMMPARVALALQEDGWYLRKDIIWHKPNPMPESCTDRPTSSHEHVFLLTKKPTYFYDAEAVKEDVTGNAHARGDGLHPKVSAPGSGIKSNASFSAAVNELVSSRNMRDVWTIATAPYAEAHFATFPPELAERCIKAGTSERGACPTCKTPWERVVEKSRTFESGSGRSGNMPVGKNGIGLQGGGETIDIRRGPCVSSTTTGWQPTCTCAPAEPIPCTVLDPFGGAGTVGLVADRLRRDAVLVELNPAYAVMARNRMTDDSPLFANVI